MNYTPVIGDKIQVSHDGGLYCDRIIGTVFSEIGFYDPNGVFHSDNDYDNKEEAAQRVAFLNGHQTSNYENK